SKRRRHRNASRPRNPASCSSSGKPRGRSRETRSGLTRPGRRTSWPSSASTPNRSVTKWGCPPTSWSSRPSVTSLKQRPTNCRPCLRMISRSSISKRSSRLDQRERLRARRRLRPQRRLRRQRGPLQLLQPCAPKLPGYPGLPAAGGNPDRKAPSTHEVLARRCIIWGLAISAGINNYMSRPYQLCGLGNAIVDIFFELGEAEFAGLGYERGTMVLVEPAAQRTLLERFQKQEARLVGGGAVRKPVVAFSPLGGG